VANLARDSVLGSPVSYWCSGGAGSSFASAQGGLLALHGSPPSDARAKTSSCWLSVCHAQDSKEPLLLSIVQLIN
jgi:hypothetical protein